MGSEGWWDCTVWQDGVSPAISLRQEGEGKQLAYRYMGGRRARTSDRAMVCDEKRTGRMLWAQGGRIVPDEFYRIGTHGLFFEDNVGRDHFANIPAKAA